MENPDAARFCMRCATPLAGSYLPGRRERRVVSVLFADLVGFTGRSERLDVEDVEDLLAPYQRLLRSSVERTGGVVAKFMGDGVMALFGAVVAHEDDPERAIRCGIAICDAVAAENTSANDRLRVRVGVTTGEALVVMGDGAAVDAVGDVVNTAARLESAAPAGGVLADERTYLATSRSIIYERVDEITAKGKSQPVPAWVAIAPRSAVPEQARTQDVRLVGRGEELGRLLATLARVRQAPAAQRVAIVGPPGIGKTRLVRELGSRALQSSGPVRWRRGRSLAYGDGVAFWALGEMVKDEAGILETDPADTAAQKLRQAVDAVVGEDREREWVARHLRPLVGLETGATASAEGGRVEAFAAWRRFLEALSEHRTTVLVFEDMHWADDALLDFVDILVERAGTVPLLVVCTARPELLDRRPDWAYDSAASTAITIAALSQDETAQFVAELLGRTPLPPHLVRSLLLRSEGNPLYAQEYVRMLGDRGLLVHSRGQWRLTGEPAEVPGSLYGIIAARLDTLSADEKRFVQDAAVIGRIAWMGAISAVSDGDPDDAERLLRELERKQLLHRARSSISDGEIELSFDHALIRDVAYSQIRRPDRARRHERAAEWLERSQRGRDDGAELLAHHYTTALGLRQEMGADTSSLSERARAALVAAGRQADAVNGYAAAARHYAAAEALTPSDDPERSHLVLAHALASFRAGETDAAGSLALAFEAQVDAGDWWLAAEAAQLLGDWNRESSGDLEQAERWWREATRCAELSGHDRVRVRVADGQASRLTEERRYAEAIALAEETMAQAQRDGDWEGFGLLLVRGGYARMCSGDNRGIDLITRAAGVLAEHGSRYVAWAYIDLSLALMMSGDMRAGQRACDQAFTWAERFGEARTVSDAEARRAFFAYHAGDWETAREITNRYITTSNRWGAGFGRWTHGLIAFAEGDDDAVTADNKAMSDINTPSARALNATLGKAPGSASSGALTEVAAPENGRHRGYRNWEIFAAAELIPDPSRYDQLLELAGRMPDDNRWKHAFFAVSERRYVDAADIFEQVGSLPLAAQARALAADQARRQGDSAETERQARLALGFYVQVGATHYAEQASALLPTAG